MSGPVLGAIAQAVIVFAFVLTLWPRPNSRAARRYLAPVVGTLAVTALGSVGGGLGQPWRSILSDVALICLLFQPFFLLRLVGVLEPVTHRVLWWTGAATGMVLFLAVFVRHVSGVMQPATATVLLVWFVAAEGYGTLRLWRASVRSGGSTRQRAIILATASSGVTAVLAALLFRALTHVTILSTSVGGPLIAVIAALYLAAVAPPRWLRHAWHMQVVLRYHEAGNADQPMDASAAISLLLDVVMTATGGVAGGFFERDSGRPLYHRLAGVGRALSQPAVGIAFETGPNDPLERAWHTGVSQVASVDPGVPVPGLDDLSGVRRLLVVPVRAGGETLGLLRVFTPLDWLFLQDDLALVEILAAHGGARIRVARALAQEVAVAHTLREANRALEAASTAKSDFLSGMSHELRTPLNAIIGFSDLLLQPQAGELTARQKRYANNILESGQHLLEIVNDVLDIAKADAARLDIRPVPVRLVQVVSAALLLVRPQAESGRVELIDATDPVMWLWADELRVRQAILNLLSNAVKFTPPGGRVVVRSAVVDAFVEVSVEDTGIGIEPADLEDVFDEFSQVSHGTDRAYEGTGLGLPLVRRLVQAMGGGVRAESIPGTGSVFTLWLPRATDPAGEVARTAPPSTGVSAPGQATVLVVDDDAMVRELCLQVLADAGYAVHTAASVAAARQSMQAGRPDVVLLDILLNEEYGDDLFSSFASLTPRPRVVVASIVDAGRHQLPGEVDAWLVKPVRPDILLACVANVLRADRDDARGQSDD